MKYAALYTHAFLSGFVGCLIGLVASFWSSNAAALGIAIALTVIGTLLILEGSVLPLVRIRLVQWAGIPLLAAAAVSLLWNHGGSAAVFGANTETRTLGMYALFTVAIFIGAFATRQSARVFIYCIEASGVLLSFVGIAAVVGVLPTTLLTESWVGIGSVLCLAALVAALESDSEKRLRYRILHGTIAAFTWVGALCLFVSGAACIAAGFALGCACFRIIQRPSISIVFVPIASILLALAFALPPILGMRMPLAEVQPAVRPSFFLSGLIVGPFYADSPANAFVGSGPATFPETWNQYRAIELNASSLWDYTPESADSELMTLAVELGLIGLAALLIIPYTIWRRYRMRPTIEHEAAAPDAMVIVPLFFLALACAYPFTVPLYLLLGLSLGVALGGSDVALSRAEKRAERYVAFAIALCMVGAGVGTFAITRVQAIGAHRAHKAESLLARGDLSPGIDLLERAIAAWRAPEYLQRLALAYAQRAARAASEAPAEAGLIQQDLDRALAFADGAVDLQPRSFNTWVFRGSLYLALSELGVDETAEKALESFKSAQLFAPTRPDVPYFIARSYRALGEPSEAQAALLRALELKPDHEDSLKLKALLEAQ